MGIYECKDLEVYCLSFDAAMDIFQTAKTFPREEKYSLIDQMRRLSRSITANIREGFAKKRCKNVFIRHLSDALGSAEETMTWLDFSYAAGYMDEKACKKFFGIYKRRCMG